MLTRLVVGGGLVTTVSAVAFGSGSCSSVTVAAATTEEKDETAARESLNRFRASVSLASATAIVDAALLEGRRRDFLPLSVAVLDCGGHLVAFKREDGSAIMRADIAIGKAWGALSMGMSTRALRDRLRERPCFQAALVGVSGGRWVAVPGGVLLLDTKREVCGAVGISGDTSDKDELCAILAAHSTGFATDPDAPSAAWAASSLSH